MRRSLLAWLVLSIAFAAPARPSDGDPAETIAKMSASEKHELLRKYQRFRDLPPQEQARLRELHQEIEADPKADEIRHVLGQYYEWVATISPGERAKLLQLDPAARLARVKELRDRQVRFESNRLSDADRQLVRDWGKRYFDSKVIELPADLRKQYEEIKGEPPSPKNWEVISAVHKALPPAGETEIAELRDTLSPEAQTSLDSCATIDDKRRRIGMWIWSGPRVGRQNVDHATLDQFFELLPEDVRESLASLPRREFYWELSKMYTQAQTRSFPGGEQPGDQPRWFPPGGRPGFRPARDAERRQSPPG